MSNFWRKNEQTNFYFLNHSSNDCIHISIACRTSSNGNTVEPTTPVKEYEEEIVETTEPVKTVIFICEECVDEDGILPITLWQTPDESGEAGNYVHHLDQCKLLDEAISAEGIEKSLLECPNGTVWTRKEAISFTNQYTQEYTPTTNVIIIYQQKELGYYLVGEEIAPGLWRNNGESEDFCYWGIFTRKGDLIDQHAVWVVVLCIFLLMLLKLVSMKDVVFGLT